MRTPKSSAEVLRKLWAAHVVRCRRRGETVPRKSTLSRTLSKDRHQLSRWMNPRVPGWRLPVVQVHPLADKLGLTRKERNELMEAVVNERMRDSPGGELLVVCRWLTDMYDEQFAPSERQVLTAWRKAAESFDLGLVGDDEEDALLVAGFERVLRCAIAKHQRAAQAMVDDAQGNLVTSQADAERRAPDSEKLRLAVQGGAFRAKRATNQLLAEALKAQVKAREHASQDVAEHVQTRTL